MSTTTYRIPKEHGAYVVLLASWIFGIAYSPVKDVVAFALVISTSLPLFLLQEPLKQLVRKNGSADAFANATVVTLTIVALASGIALVIRSSLVVVTGAPLLLIGGIYFSMLRLRRGAIARSFVGFAGLTLAAPLTMIAAEESIPRPFTVWILTTLFFCTSIYCVAIRLREAHAVRNAIIYHLLATLFVVYMSLGFFSPPLLPMLVMTIPLARLIVILLFRKRYASLGIKYIGMQESAVALAAILLILLW